MGIINLNGKPDQESEPEVAKDIEQQMEDTTVEDTLTPINEEKAKAEVTLDGPLSSVYTKALNLVYANEGVDTMTITPYYEEEEEDAIIEENAAEDKDKYGNDLYIYCCNGNNLSQEGLVDATNHLCKVANGKKYKNILVSIECRGEVNSKVALLDDVSTQLGAKVCFSQRAAIEAIKKHTRA